MIAVRFFSVSLRARLYKFMVLRETKILSGEPNFNICLRIFFFFFLQIPGVEKEAGLKAERTRAPATLDVWQTIRYCTISDKVIHCGFAGLDK